MGGKPKVRGEKMKLKHTKVELPLLCTVILLGMTCMPVLAATYRSITFENASIGNYQGADTNGNNGYWTLTDSGTNYKIATKNSVAEGIVTKPAISTAEHYEGSKSLRMFFYANTTGHTPGEKTLIDVCSDTNSFAPVWGQKTAVSFAIKLPTNFQAPGSNLMLCEWWNGSGGAALTLYIKPGTTQWAVDMCGNAGTYTITGNTLTRGSWYTFAIECKPAWNVNGVVSVWQNGTKVFSNSSHPIGFDPGTSTRKFAVCVGLYRPGCNTTAEAYFDKIKFGDSFSDVRY